MSTFDLSASQEPGSLLETLPRRATLTLSELRFAADLAGGAPLPFDVSAPRVTDLGDRLGATGSDSDNGAYRDALATLHPPAESLTRRGLLVEETLEPGIAGALGILGAPDVALEIDVQAAGGNAKSWQRATAGAVATLSTCDGIVFDLAWFPALQWPHELGRVAVLPEDFRASRSAIPELCDLPFELLNVGTEAQTTRPDLIGALIVQQSGASIDADGKPLGDAEVASVIGALATEVRGRLRILMSRVTDDRSVPIGVVSWVLVCDGWRSLRPHHQGEANRIEIRSVDASDLASAVAPILARVTR